MQVDAPKFEDYVLPLIYVKRLPDVFDDEDTRLVAKFGGSETVMELQVLNHGRLIRILLQAHVPDAPMILEDHQVCGG